VSRGSFPRYVWAQQPFQDLKAISHEVAPGVRARIAFEGETFEMEDQRNWADASYKIYSTPLRLPFPVELKKGAKVAQSVTLTVEGATSTTRIVPSSIPISVGASAVCELPQIRPVHGRPRKAAVVLRGEPPEGAGSPTCGST
jgi:hypothetical protein